MPTTLRKFSRRAGVLLASVLACCLLAGPLSVIFPQAADAATVSDNFDRANGGLGSNWTTVAGTAAPQISANTLHAGTASSLNSAYWSASTFSSDQFAQGTLPASSGGNYGPGLAVRLSASKGYILWYGNSTSTVSLWRMDSASSWTQLKSSGTLKITAATDVWKIQVVGSTITGYQNGTQVVQTTDTKITSGSPGVWLYYAANQIDNWSGGDASAAPTTYTVGGTVSGLASGGTVVLQDNSGNDLSVSASGAFTFSTALASGAAYNVTVKTSPTGQTCTVAGGSGTIGSANVTNVAVTCKANPTYTVGGTVSGLASGSTVVLQNNGGNDLSVTASGAFTFSTALAPGAAYNVTVRSNPPGQNCTVAGGTGTIGSANVTNVAVTCTTTPTTYTVGGTVSGLASGGTVVLQNNGSNDLSVTSNGAFTFSTALASGAAYNVTVKTSPTGQTCTVASGTGTVGSANVTNVAVTCATSGGGGGGGGGTGGTTVSDTFDRANGGLGSNWTTTPGTAAPQISASTMRAGTASTPNSAYWSANSFGSDQFAQGTLPASSGSSDGPGVAVRLSGTKGYFLWYGNATNTVSLWRMDSASSWTQLKASGTLTITPATDVWKIQVVGSTITGYQNGTQVVQATDTSITSGSPGVWLYYAANQIDNWSGGDVATTPGSYTVGGTVSGLASGGTVVLQNNGGNDLSVTASGSFTFSTALASGAAYTVTVKTNPLSQTCTVASGTGTVGSANVTNVAVTCTTSGGSGGTNGLQVTYVGTDANGVQSYNMLSSEDGGTTQVLRVLPPSNPAAGVKHNFLFMLPVETGQGSTYGDGIATAEAANEQNQYNLTLVEPSFPTDPWYADNPASAGIQYETFMTTQLVPWVKANLSITGTEQNWLIGFSKSGIGGQDLLLKHPDVFSVAASWDFPADMSSYDGADPYGTVGGGSAGNYGTDANFQANYRLSSSFLSAHQTPFTSANRIWIGSYAAFQPDMADYDALLTQLGIQHTTEAPTYMAHRWDSGWVPLALGALEQDSVALGG